MEKYRTYTTAFRINMILKRILFTWLFIAGANNLYAQDTSAEVKVSINFTAGEKLDGALKRLEKTAGVTMAFDPKATAEIPVKPGKFVQTALHTILRYLLNGNGFSFKNESGSILIFKSSKPVVKAQPGKLTGRVADKEDGQAISGATFRIGNKAASTDTSGMFSISLPSGKYEAEISFIGYVTNRITEIVIRENKTVTLNIPLTKDKGHLSEVVISARKIQETGTNAAIINEIREADAVVSGISKEQIARGQDRDAAEVVRRIPGVSVMQNRFIVVRGLPQRYNSVMLNGTIAPSFEPDSRAFSFDIMPSSMIDRIMVYKTAIPELPGDFAGGVVKVYTTGMPAKNAFNVTFQTSFLQNTSLNSFYEEPQGRKAWLGYDDGTYALPKEFKRIRDINGRIDVLPVAERRSLGKLFNENWDAGQKNAPLDKRFNIDLARRFSLGNKIQLGFVSAFSHSDTYSHQSTSRNTGMYGGDPLKFDREYSYNDQSYEHAVRLNGLLNIALDIGEKHRVEFKNLYTHLGSSLFVDRIGLAGQYATSRDADKYIGYKFLTNTYRGTYLGQLSGNHKFFNKNTEVNWILAYNQTEFSNPDQRVRFFDADPAKYYGRNSLVETGLTSDVLDYNRGRQYISLPDTSKTIGVDIIQHFNLLGIKPSLKAGVFIEEKGRTFEFIQLGQVLDNPDFGPGWVINEVYGRANSYTASNLLQAGYISTEIPIGAFKLNGGVRIEKNRQQLNTFSYQTVGPLANQKIDLDRKHTSFLPSVNLSYNITTKSLIRAAYAKTLNRPEFREIASFFYKDFYTGRLAYGNPDLKTQTDIDNVDLRFEYYPGLGEMISIGAFYKKFKNPVEFYYYASTGGRTNYDWGNAESAKNYGAELEFVLGLRRYFSEQNWVSRQMQKIAVLFNAAYIYSRVNLGSRAGIQDKVRPVYGQSPYLFNSSINYTDEAEGLKISMAHNVIGKRIFSIGNTDSPNIYEMPRNLLDLTFSKRFAKIWELKGGIQNILNAPNLMMQDITGDGKYKVTKGGFADVDNLYESSYTGTYYTLGIGIRL